MKRDPVTVSQSRKVLSSAIIGIFAMFAFSGGAFAQGGVGPKILLDPSAPGAEKQVSVKGGSESQVTTSLTKDGITVNIKAGPENWPSIILKQAGGAPWDLSLYGHVEAKITNTGNKKISVSMRVDNEGEHKTQPWNCESKKIEPGQTKTIRVYFGFSYGFQKSFPLKPEKITQILFFTDKTDTDLSYRIENIMGAGWVGEKVGVDPDRVARKPANGVILDAGSQIKLPGQALANNGAKASAGPDGKLLQIDFAGGKDESITFIPADGLWNLNEQLQIKVKLKNIGQVPVTPSVKLESDSGPSELIAAASAIAPGAEAEIIVPFAPRVPWKGQQDPAQEDPKKKGSWGPQPGTGTNFRSNIVSGVTLVSDKTTGSKTLLVTSIIADLPPLQLPEWLGKKPPVEGDWVQTLNEEFEGDSLDLNRWNLFAANWYDKRMHFSKDQAIVKDGKLTIRLEKKRGFQNDIREMDTTFKGAYAGLETDYATAQPVTSGKWAQRYGYFEIREKQPTAKCCWPGFWMMPDRGVSAASKITNPNPTWLDIHNANKARGDTGNGGMEFDITESQSSWGIHRFNVAFHWDGYGEAHKSIGTSSNYVQADKDGFITVGFLWLPGKVAVYGNGKEIFCWESPRVSSIPAYLILQNEIGGWDNEQVDDAELPADYVVDYIRVWQRKDLATPEDGPKPNRGTLIKSPKDLLPPD